MVAENKIGESEPATLPEAIMAKLPFGKFYRKCLKSYYLCYCVTVWTISPQNLTEKLTLLLADPPGPPRNLQIENLTKTSCTLVWEKPSFDGGAMIIGYFVEKSTGYRYLLILITKRQLHKVKTL